MSGNARRTQKNCCCLGQESWVPGLPPLASAASAAWDFLVALGCLGLPWLPELPGATLARGLGRFVGSLLLENARFELELRFAKVSAEESCWRQDLIKKQVFGNFLSVWLTLLCFL